MIYGVDISEAQGAINWPLLNESANFVIIRADFGTVRKDNQFDTNIAQARSLAVSAGPLARGYYHYAYPEYAVNTPEAEANFFADNVGQLQPGEIIALDFEEPYSGDPVAWSLAWLQTAEARLAVKGAIYMDQALYNAHDWSPLWNAGYHLWIAKYDYDKNGPEFDNAPIRQWSNIDAVAGIANKVDGDTFYGSFDDWNALGYQAAVPPPPPPAPEPTPPVPDPTPTPDPVPPTPEPVPPVPTPTPIPPSPTPTPQPIDKFFSWLYHLIFFWKE